MHARTAVSRSTVFRTGRLLLGAAVLGVLSACSSDTMTSPEMSPSYAAGPGSAGTLLGGPAGNSGPGKIKAVKHSKLVDDESVTKRIDSKGGEIELKASRFKLTIPKGALLFPVDITVSRIDGDDVAYEFQPHGLVFLRPLLFSQDLRDTELDGIKTLGDIKGAYFKDIWQITPLGALVNELMPARLNGNRLEMDIWHFSGYMMSTGRAASEEPTNPEPF